jgi:hypothetical protein
MGLLCKTTIRQDTTGQCMAIEVEENKAAALLALSKLSAETLAQLAELSHKPGIELKLRKNMVLIKSFL